MYKILLASLILVGAEQLLAQSMSNDFGSSDQKKEFINVKDLRTQFELLGEIFVTDNDGKLLFQGNEARVWKFGKKGDLVSNWSFKSPDINPIAIRHTWTLSGDGKLVVHIQQFDSMKYKGTNGDVELGKLIKEENIEVKDFKTIEWLAGEDTKTRVTVRFTPRLDDKSEFIQVDALPVTLNNPVIFDNKGRLWAQGRNLEGRYISLKTHLGQIALSYTPFKGAKEIGFAQGSEITINADPDLVIYFRNESPILSTNKAAKIYGLVDMKKKSDRFNSLYSSSSSREKEFLKGLE
jgi:hypothetical protein